MVVSQRRAFLADVTSRDACPEFSGYNTNFCCEQGLSFQPKTKAVYLQLIVMPPPPPSANSDTIITVMIKAHQS